MTVVALVADGPYLALASDDSGRGDPPASARRKLHPLSSRLPIAAGFGGFAGAKGLGPGGSLRAFMDRYRARLDGEDVAGYTVEGVARRLAPELHAAFGHHWRPDTGDGIAGFVAGYSAGERVPEVVYLAVKSEGVVRLDVIMRGGAGGCSVLPKADTPERVRQPQSLGDAAALAASLVQRRIEEHAANPSAGRDALGPIYGLTVSPDHPTRPFETDGLPLETAEVA